MSDKLKNWIFLCLSLTLVAEVNSLTCNSLSHQVDDTEEVEEIQTDNGRPLQALPFCYPPNKSKVYTRLRKGYINLDCGRCSIWTVDIYAWVIWPKKCWGLTPSLLVSSTACHWKQRCTLSYDNAFILTAGHDNQMCVGEYPNSLEMSYSCLSAEAVVDDVMKLQQSGENLQGLIRSHDFNRTAPVSYKHLVQVLDRSSNKYRLKIEAPDNFIAEDVDPYLLIKVLSVDIDSADRLKLVVPTKACTIETWDVTEIYNLTTWSFTMEFDVNKKPGLNLGFEICFQWFSPHDENVEAKFSATVEVCNRTMGRSKDFVYNIIQNSVTQHTKGFLRSHRLHPQNYPFYILNSEKDGYTFLHKLRAPVDRRYLRMQVHNLNLIQDDTLEVTGGNKKVTNLKQYMNYDFTANTITINLTITDTHDRKLSSHFLLCYRWYALDETMSTELCSDSAYIVNSCKADGGKQIRRKCGLISTNQDKKDKQNERKERKRKRVERRERRRMKRRYNRHGGRP